LVPFRAGISIITHTDGGLSEAAYGRRAQVQCAIISIIAIEGIAYAPKLGACICLRADIPVITSPHRDRVGTTDLRYTIIHGAFHAVITRHGKNLTLTSYTHLIDSA